MVKMKHTNIVTVVLVLAVLSFIASLAILFMPLGETGGDLSNRATVSAAISTSFALVAGIIAIIVTTMVSSSDYKAEQAVKEDTARLLASLRSIMTKGAILGQKPSNAMKSLNFLRELEVVNDFLSSTTAFAYMIWEGHKSESANDQPEEWHLFFIYLVDILDSGDDYREMMTRALAIEKLLTSLCKGDIRSISKSLSDLETAISDYNVSHNSVLVTAVMEGYGQSMDPEMTYRKFVHLKNKGVKDRNIDMFLAVLHPDINALQAALETGADPSMTDTQLFEKYRDELNDFHPTN
jgi:hypothetical protein